MTREYEDLVESPNICSDNNDQLSFSASSQLFDDERETCADGGAGTGSRSASPRDQGRLVPAGSQQEDADYDDGDEAMEPWGCSTCTYLNEYTKRTCDMCGDVNKQVILRLTTTALTVSCNATYLHPQCVYPYTHVHAYA